MIIIEACDILFTGSEMSLQFSENDIMFGCHTVTGKPGMLVLIPWMFSKEYFFLFMLRNAIVVLGNQKEELVGITYLTYYQVCDILPSLPSLNLPAELKTVRFFVFERS